MMLRTIAWVFVINVLITAPAFAQATLAWKFAKGQVYEVERSATQKQTVALKGSVLKQESTSVWQVRLAVKEKHADGHFIQATLLKVEHRVILEPKANNVEAKFAETLQGSTFNLLVSPGGRILELKGYDDLLDRLVAAIGASTVSERQRREGLQAVFPEAALKEAFADFFGPLPDKAVAKGDAWERTFVEPIPHFGSLRASAKYVYVGTIDKRERIDVSIQSKYEAPKNEAMVLFKIVKGNLTDEKARGTITFDAVAGQVVQHERSLNLRGTLTIDMMGREQTIDFTSVSEIKARVQKK